MQRRDNRCFHLCCLARELNWDHCLAKADTNQHCITGVQGSVRINVYNFVIDWFDHYVKSLFIVSDLYIYLICSYQTIQLDYIDSYKARLKMHYF